MSEVAAEYADLRYAALEARLAGVVKDERRGAVREFVTLVVVAGVFALALARGPLPFDDLLPRLPAVVTSIAVAASALLTAFHLVLEFRARRRELKARVMIIDGELLRARIAAMRANLG